MRNFMEIQQLFTKIRNFFIFFLVSGVKIQSKFGENCANSREKLASEMPSKTAVSEGWWVVIADRVLQGGCGANIGRVSGWLYGWIHSPERA